MRSEGQSPEEAELGPLGLTRSERRRARAGIFAIVALGATGYLPAVTVAPLAAHGMLGTARWSGIPTAMTIAGLALGSRWLSRVMARRSRSAGLLLGYAVAAGAAALAGLAAEGGWFLPFSLCMLLLGTGLGARHLARYVAGDLARPERRGVAIALAVWFGTIGSILGPLLLSPAQRVAARIGGSGIAGPYFLCVGACLAACVVLWGVSPALSRPASSRAASRRPGLAGWAALRSEPRCLFAVTAMACGQFVMVLIMAMTPVHIRNAGEGLGLVGRVLSAHALGMFALSPLTGFLSDRWGRKRVIFLGQAVMLLAAVLAGPTHGGEERALVVSLFLLGLGWNFGFVGGSALLSESAPREDRLEVQGSADTVVWTAAAIASFLSGVLLAALGYPTLNAIGAGVILVPAVLALRWRRALSVSA